MSFQTTIDSQTETRGYAPLVLEESQDSRLQLMRTRVLLIEDTADARILFYRIIKRSGAEVVAVASAEEAWGALAQFDPDVIVSDIGLPEEDGISFIRRFRIFERPTGRHTPALAVTAFSQYREVATRAGFDDCLSKPATGSQLIRRILEVLRPKPPVLN